VTKLLRPQHITSHIVKGYHRPCRRQTRAGSGVQNTVGVAGATLDFPMPRHVKRVQQGTRNCGLEHPSRHSQAVTRTTRSYALQPCKPHDGFIWGQDPIFHRADVTHRTVRSLVRCSSDALRASAQVIHQATATLHIVALHSHRAGLASQSNRREVSIHRHP
jgi:hypothetical protein